MSTTRVHAQAKELEKGNETQTAPSKKSKKTKESWKARRARRAASKKRKEQLKAAENKENKGEDLEDIDKENQEPHKKPKERDEQQAGSVLAKKIFEPLDALLQAHKARLKPHENLEERWKRYLDLAVEAR